ncbi:hypothetical protein [Pseudactinotalea sp. Z1732]|uniref:hypothetical protein n=1 Tax=Micrococcales TaxID=85006 RepID=UPI003C7AD3F2
MTEPPQPPPGKPSRAQRRQKRWEAPPGAPPVPTVPTGPAGSPTAEPAASPGQSPYGQRSAPPPMQESSGNYGHFTFPQMPKAKLEPRAVLGLITSVLGLPGLVLGLLARPRVKGGRRRSPALAMSAIVLGALFTVGWILTVITLALTGTFDRLTETPQAGDTDTPRTIASATLAEGNCILTLPPARPVGDVRVVPCAQTHIAQVISVHTLDGDFPGQEELETQADQVCTDQVEALPTDEVQVMPWYLIPSGEGWQEGNTQLMCLARGATGPFEGDLLN